jgi:hypothetical protein
MGIKKATQKLSRLYIGSAWAGIFAKFYITFLSYFYIYKNYTLCAHFLQAKIHKRAEKEFQDSERTESP